MMDTTVHVLLVDKEEALAQSLASILNAQGYGVSTTTDAGRALSLCESGGAQVVIIDAGLPAGGGMELLRRVTHLDHPPACLLMADDPGVEGAVEQLFGRMHHPMPRPPSRGELLRAVGQGAREVALDRERRELQAALSREGLAHEEARVRLSRLLSGIRASLRSTDGTALATRVLAVFAAAVSSGGGSIYLRERGGFRLGASLDPGHAAVWIDHPPTDRTLFARAVGAGQPVAVNGVARVGGSLPSGWTGYRNDSALVVPLTDTTGEVVALVSLHDRAEPPFTERDAELVASLSPLACEILRCAAFQGGRRESPEKLRRLFDDASAGILVVNLATRNIEDANPAALRMFVCSRQDMVGHRLLDQALDREAIDGVFERMARDNEEGCALPSVALLACDGSGFTADLRCAAYTEDDGTRSAVVWLREVGDRPGADQELSWLRSIVEDCDELICLATLDGRIVYLNGSGLRMVGLGDLSEARERSVYDLIPSTLHHEVRERFSVQSSTCEGLEGHGRLRNMATGEEREVFVRMRSQSGTPDGKPVALNVTMTDVTERKRLEDQLRTAQRMEALGRLAGGTAHDFNSVLMAVKGFADLLGEHAGVPESALEYAHEIRRAAERGAELTRKLLAFSGRQVCRPVELDLNGLVVSFVPMLTRLVGEPVQIRTQLAEDLPPVRADPGQVEQVMMNLVVNARDAMPGGGVVTLETADRTLERTLQAHPDSVPPGRYVVLSVRDVGAGMDATTMARVFDPFFTTKSVGKGTGLGLSTVYGVVRQNEGLVNVTSRPGQGSTFRVYLPAQGVARHVAEGGPPPERPATEATRRELSVLVVERKELVRGIVTRMLASKGHRVRTVTDGPAALRLLETLTPEEVDLLIIDVNLPELSGPQVFDLLRDRRPYLPVVFLAAEPHLIPTSDWDRIRQGVFLEMPFSLDALMGCVDEALRKHHLTRP